MAPLPEFPDSPSVYSPAFSRPDFDDISQGGSDEDDRTDDASHRISLQGPKIRFHSRAPWETDDVLSPPEEPDNGLKPNTFGSKLKGKASRADNLIRTFTRGRPSVDSTRSQASTTSSFEATAGNYSSSRGALYDLARQSISTSSLSSSASVRHQNFARTANNPMPSHYPLQPHTADLDGSIPVPIRPSSDASRVSNEHSAKPSSSPSPQKQQSRDEFIHPYANPDLVVAYTPPPEAIPPHPVLEDMSGSDTNSTVTDSTSTRSAAVSVISTETSTTSFTSREHAHGHPRIYGKEISSPISVIHQSDISYVDRDTRFLSLHPPPHGFEGPRLNNPRTSAVTLISLQEAQARERFRGNTVQPMLVRSKPSFPNSDDIPDATEDQPMDKDITRTRARSTSVGTRQRAAPLPSAQDEMKDEFAISTVVPGRALKHKKSGFMRLFGGRTLEEEREQSPPPPIPPLDVHAERIHGSGKTSKLIKVPRASFSPTSHSGTGNFMSNNTPDGSDGKGPSPRKRQPPTLSIVTKTSEPSLPIISSPISSHFTPPPPLSLTVPQSAPPGNSDFTGLKLRPVSTSFSSHFADIVVDTAEELQRDVHTPSSTASSGTALSPFTPISTRRSDDASASAAETSGEECLTIKGLQDQLVSAKLAWQQQIWELRGQIRDLTSELEDLRAVDNQDYCEVCGRGEPPRRHASPMDEQHSKKVGVVNRPRVRTGDTARFASGN